MKITGVTTTLLGSGHASKWIGAQGRARGTATPRCLLELETDERPIGVAIGAASIHSFAKPLTDELLLGADPRATTMLWQRLSQANAQADGALGATIAALDIAIWDLKAKLNDEPLWRTLGGLRPRVNTHTRAHAIDEPTFDRWLASLTPAATRGVVLAASSDASIDAQRLRNIRDALATPGHDCELMLDADERWTPKDAIRAMAALEREVDLAWVEAPIARGDFLGHKRIVDSIRGGVCAGGRFAAMTEFLPHLHHRSLNTVQLDITRVGITAALQIADAAYGFELPIALTASPGNIHAHLGAALPYCVSMELDDGRAGVDSDVHIEDGLAIGGDRPGHGLSIDRSSLASS